MRLVMTGAVLAMLAGLAYAAWPFWTAWGLREAIRTADTAHLERKIEWDSVRASLKASLARHAQLVPEISAENEVVRPGLWQRVKMAFGQSMIDSFVERYVTPAGLPQLLEYRKAYSARVRREPEDATHSSSSWRERLEGFWSRLKRAEFKSPWHLEIEMEDRRNTSRRYISVLELRDFEWKLTELRVTAAPARISANQDAIEASAMPTEPARPR